MLRYPHILSAVALTVMVAIAGCNVLGSAYEEGGSVENAIEDAQHARATGDYDRAVNLLEDALAQEPENPVVRVELSSTLLQRANISLLSLEQVTGHLLGELGIETEGARGEIEGARGVSADSCTWDSNESVRTFDPLAVEGYADIVGAAPAIAQVLDLLNDASIADAAVIPSVLADLDPCDAIQDGQIAYDREALLAELRDRFDDNDRRVNAALTMNAVAHTLMAYMDLFENEAFPVAWFIVGEEEDTRLGFCMDEQNIDPFYTAAESQVDRVAQATFSLDLLIHNSGDEEMQELVDEAIDLYVEFEESLGQYCGD